MFNIEVCQNIYFIAKTYNIKTYILMLYRQGMLNIEASQTVQYLKCIEHM